MNLTTRGGIDVIAHKLIDLLCELDSSLIPTKYNNLAATNSGATAHYFMTDLPISTIEIILQTCYSYSARENNYFICKNSNPP